MPWNWRPGWRQSDKADKFSEDSGKPETYFKEGDLEGIEAWQAQGGLFEKHKSATMFDAFHTDSLDTLYRTRHSGRSDAKEVCVTSVEDIGNRKLYSVFLIFDDHKVAEALRLLGL